MRSRAALVLAGLVICTAAAVRPALSQELTYMTMSGGWSWPVDGPVQDANKSGFTLGGSFLTPVAYDLLTGFAVAYAWHALDTDRLGAKNPGTSFDGGDLGLLSVTAENDLLLGSPSAFVRPFVNLGLGFYRTFGDDVIASGATSGSYSTGVYVGSFFGFHTGVGILIHRERFGVRLDADYHYLFAAGDDLGFIPVRAGVVFYPHP